MKRVIVALLMIGCARVQGCMTSDECAQMCRPRRVAFFNHNECVCSDVEPAK